MSIISFFARRLLRACGLPLALVGLLACGNGTLVNPPAFQVPVGNEGSGDARVGEHFYFGITGLDAMGPEKVTLTSAMATNPPPGLNAEVRAAHFDRSITGIPPESIGGLREASVRSGFPHLVLYPVSSVTFVKGRHTDWYLVVVLTAHRPGTFSIPGVEVRGDLGAHPFRSTIGYKMTLTAHDPHARIDMSKPVDLLADCPGWSDPAPTAWTQLAHRAVSEGGGVAVVNVVGQPASIWNTSDGHRPTQQEVDRGLVPLIYGPLVVRVVRPVSGASPPAGSLFTTLILGGGIGQDSVDGCYVTIDPPQPDNAYLFVFGPAITGIAAAATDRPVVQFRSIAIMDGNEANTAFGSVQVP